MHFEVRFHLTRDVCHTSTLFFPPAAADDEEQARSKTSGVV